MNEMKAFSWALAIVLSLEGGYTTADGGTNYGIRASTLARANSLGLVQTRDIRDITRWEATKIYYRLYWLPSGATRYPKPLNLVVFDAAVHMGVARSRELMRTLARNASSLKPHPLAIRYVLERYRVLRASPKFRKYPGWRKRIGVILRCVKEM